MKSLQAQLRWGLIVSLAISFGLLWLLAEISLTFMTEEALISRLEHDADEIITILILDPDGTPRLATERLSTVYRPPYSGHYYRIDAPKGILFSRSLWDQTIQLQPVVAGQTLHRHPNGPQDQPLLAVTKGYRKQGHPITITIAEDLTFQKKSLSNLRKRFGWISMVILTGLLTIQTILLKRGLAPLEHTRQELERFKEGQISTLQEENLPSELTPLVQEINRLVQGMNRRLERSRNALGNLAHALKTPLTLLIQTTDSPEVPEPIEMLLHEQTLRIQELINRELKRARVAGRLTPGQELDIPHEMTELIEALTLIYRNKPLTFEFTPPKELRFSCDREDFLELMGNLLDNACHWATKQIRIVFEPGANFFFTIEDDGPGGSEETLARLRTGKRRIDENVTGNGLGLAIVHDILDQYEGKIFFEQSAQLGGLQVNVQIPTDFF
ncbi:MAG: ATP-binding protein [Magnetococcus sp. DMHC-6]